MTSFSVWGPWLIYLVGIEFFIAVFVMYISILFFRHKLKWLRALALLGSGLLLISALFLLEIGIFAGDWIHAAPSPDWQNRANQIDTAVILEFGHENDGQGNVTPGAANTALLKWALEHTGTKMIWAQEGVWSADYIGPGGKVDVKLVRADEKVNDQRNLLLLNERTVTLQRIYLYKDNVNVRTSEALEKALERLLQSGKRKAVLICHPLQLQRAVYDYERLKIKRKEFNDIELIIPDIPKMPCVAWPAHGQFYTQNTLFYSWMEVLCFRPQDFKQMQ